MNVTVFTVEGDSPSTVQNYLMKKCGVSRRLLTRLKRIPNGITCNGLPIRSVDTVNPGDVIALSDMDSSFLEPNNSLNVPVVYEDEKAVVFDKPGGMPVHPSIKHQGDTLGNCFSAMFPGLTFRPVNRLDKDTSGLCIIAKNAHAANLLQGSCHKIYFAAVQGITDEQGTINAPIAREKESIILRCVRDDGQPAVTHFQRIDCCNNYSLERIILETGRTHQIRVHFSYIGHPLAGDDMYGGSREHISRQALHCGSLSFNSGKGIITVESPLPEDILYLFRRK